MPPLMNSNQILYLPKSIDLSLAFDFVYNHRRQCPDKLKQPNKLGTMIKNKLENFHKIPHSFQNYRRYLTE